MTSLIHSKLSIIDFRNIVSASSNASRLRSPANHSKFIKNNLIPEYRSSGNHRIHRFPDFRCGSIDNQSRKGGNVRPLETRFYPRLGVKSIFSNSNMEIQIQIYGNLFVPITLINHGYANILTPFEPTEIEVQSHSEINCTRGNYV